LDPHPTEAVDPLVDLVQGLGPDGVEAAGALGPGRGEAVLPQHSEVLGDRGLGDPELGGDHLGDRARGGLPVGQELEDPASDRIAEDVERVHDAVLSGTAYISNN